MRLIYLALAAVTSIASAQGDSNLTHESRNILPPTFKPAPYFRNVNLVRNINLEKSYPRETINVVIENIDKAPQGEYYIPFEKAAISRVGGLEVRDKKEPGKTGFVAEVVEIDPYSSTQYYKITLPSPLGPGEQQTLSITYQTLSALRPLPAAIEQTSKQYVLFTFSAYAPSAYTTSKQKTKLKLPTTDVPDVVKVDKSLNTDGQEDPQKQGTTYTYGPYGEVEAGAVQEVSVRYDFTHSLTHGSLLERDIEVSHWGGNVAVEERHWLSNRGATLKDNFSRTKWQASQYYQPPTSALREMKFPLAVGSVDAYFIDDIGNVSTSRFRTNSKEANLELKPRYPLFGGWNYSFKVGWNGNLKDYLRKVKSGDTYILKVPFVEGPKQSEGVEYERVVTRVILPEGATNIQFTTNMPGLVINSTSLHRTFMDTLGRSSLTLTALNVVDDLRDRDLVVTYDYPFTAGFRKPFTIFAGVLAVFVGVWALGSLDTSIGRKKYT
ncbi:Ribophorin I [Polychaeton citri CBS 116435]|uniref:Dolichyl-diphosphooligosaccharide--protein glycosyltransferase subunit 1 n=1 Tax=Polychaeton citri CBS 116435 TaxID=1314669 RepID=A0A9P4URQ7_9PEZI|nr:Ribophorin I [Polychaeton citri CBS 116435]